MLAAAGAVNTIDRLTGSPPSARRARSMRSAYLSATQLRANSFAAPISISFFSQETSVSEAIHASKVPSPSSRRRRSRAPAQIACQSVRNAVLFCPICAVPIRARRLRQVVLR
jgi:hypothetical protein